MSDVLSKRNLGPAEQWGREIEGRFRYTEKNNVQLNQMLNNSSRAFSGQLAVLTNQVTELYDRSIVTESIPNFDVTGNATVEPFPVATRSLVIDGTGVARSALIAVNAAFNDSVPSSGSSIYVEILVDGLPCVRTNVTGFGRPAMWDMGSMSSMFPVVIAPNGSTLQMSLVRVGFTATTSTWTASKISVSTYYGDKV